MVSINIWAVIVCGILSVVLGFIWYGPLFGKQWMALSNIKMPDVRPPMSAMLRPMIISIIGAIIMAICLTYSLAYAQAFMNISGIKVGLQAGFWNWLGFMIPVNLSFVAWENKSWKLFLIHSGYWLVLIAIMGMILAVWK